MLEAPKQGAPGPWEPYQNIQIPIAAVNIRSEHTKALEEYKRYLSASLSDQFYQFLVSDDGYLLVRPGDGREDVARVHLSESHVYTRLCGLLGELGLGAPPAYQPLSPIPTQVDNRRDTARGGLQRLLRRLVRSDPS